jgi:hypothetical protein
MNLNVDSFLNRRGIGGIMLIGVIAFGVALSTPGSVEGPDAVEGVDATVYKSPSCGCCGAWASYAEKHGMNIEVENVQDIGEAKQEQDIPGELESCHTTVLDDYVVEGHVPVDAVAKLLEEGPGVHGIGMPGMPQGSPGMPGPKNTDWTISSFTESGETSVFMTV